MRAAVPAAVFGVALLLGSHTVAQTAAGARDDAGGVGVPRGVADQSAALPAYRVDGDRIDAALTDTPGDPVRGRAIVADRHKGLCLLCHAGPIPEERFQGNLAPDLAGAGSRWSVPQLRLRMVDARRVNPDTIMPAYYRTAGLTRVTPALRMKPILNAQEIEDVVAYLHGLTDSSADPNRKVMTK